jgi:hypothetical protein
MFELFPPNFGSGNARHFRPYIPFMPDDHSATLRQLASLLGGTGNSLTIQIVLEMSQLTHRSFPNQVWDWEPLALTH